MPARPPRRRVPPTPTSEPPPSGAVPSDRADTDAFDLRCVRYRYGELARLGCGDPACAVETCAIARHARLIMRGLDALERERTHT